jgi:hypothetical protein
MQAAFKSNEHSSAALLPTFMVPVAHSSAALILWCWQAWRRQNCNRQRETAFKAADECFMKARLAAALADLALTEELRETALKQQMSAFE